MQHVLYRIVACVALLLLGACGSAAPSAPEECISSEKLSYSVALIRLDPHFSWGPKGTLWFLDTGRQGQYASTNAHVVKSLGLSEMWQEVTLYPAMLSGKALSVYARIVLYRTYLGGLEENLKDERPLLADDMAVIEFRHIIPGVTGLSIRATPLRVGEEVRVLGYPGGMLRYGYGHTVDKLYPGIAHVQLRTKEGYWFGGGSSGLPIVDCQGSVIAILSLYSGQFDNGAVHADALLPFLRALSK
jgi:hypothetical protein